jgi:transposase
VVFQEKIKRYEAARVPIVYLDESGFALDMPRPYGYASVGERCSGTQDWQAKGRTNVIGALIGHTLLTACLFEGTINSGVFHAWVAQDLLPQVPKGAVIVMDNATFHKRSDTQALIQEAGCPLEFLPPYSPDLNPIEHKWAQAKALRKKLQCPVSELFAAHLH